MKILVAPQELKGTLTAAQAAQAIATALTRTRPELELDVVPLADGGPGTVEAFLSSARGARQLTPVHDPLGRPVEAPWALLDDGTAVIEMATASGLGLVAEAERDPLSASSFGTGELVRAALDAGAKRILVGAGGSATNDGGVGAAVALGVRLFDARDGQLGQGPRELARLARLDLSGLDPRLGGVQLEAITDVRNPLCGPDGASLVYGPQKGADDETCELLDGLLARLAQTVTAQLGTRLDSASGSGAGGGLPFGLAALCGARISSGFEAISAVLKLFSRIQAADVVVTAEGRFDSQSAYFKGPFALARLARMQGKRVVIFAGEVAVGADRATFDEVVAVSPPGLSKEELSKQAYRLLEAAAAKWAGTISG
ncbi:MAG: glycerate kinase family protein [Myxococcaceae bacterium]